MPPAWIPELRINNQLPDAKAFSRAAAHLQKSRRSPKSGQYPPAAAIPARCSGPGDRLPQKTALSLRNQLPDSPIPVIFGLQTQVATHPNPNRTAPPSPVPSAMAKNSSIEWTHHTFNPWWGCVKVSPACQHCYAETFSKRTGHGVWGQNSPRRFFGEQRWDEPIQWNAEAVATGERRRVFCASMADVFEERADLVPWRGKLWDTIKQTPMLDWLLLTKRPENIGEMVPWTNDWPENIWLGTTVETQKYVDERLPHLLKHKSKFRFLSCEPMLGEVDLKHWIEANNSKGLHGIDWIIAGGESGSGARPMNPNWACKLRDQALSKGVAFHFKQWGQWAPSDHLAPGYTGKATVIDGVEMIRLKSKKNVGRSLDGTTWDEFPDSRLARKTISKKMSNMDTKRSKSSKPQKAETSFDLIDKGQIGLLRCNFTACIVDLFDLDNRDVEIYKCLAKEIRPLLVEGANVLVKASTKTCDVIGWVFRKQDFEFQEMLIHTFEDSFNPWLLFRCKGHGSKLHFRKNVFSSKFLELEKQIFRSIDPNHPFTPQDILREFVKMLCPEPFISHALVPYFGFGSAIAACQAVGVRCVGYDPADFHLMTYGDENFATARDTISKLTKIEV